ncbi:helix-turn-helix domain containing protein [Polyangium sp. rjm3]|uniref:Helix-turn-helix domain containing protein n=1 Tax=Polyangium mundeleinium TaxID=2995306 RepID=A0ABT5F083_9BACT|nr:helix-turn-helix domain-containing protein [Polyangium mundeleinium]MDC0747493.1 helix-turn-helix domain containing protein [Polyangium mundeleinium]
MKRATSKTAAAEAPKELRADAQRNRERLLAVADEVFSERGADASLEDIARRAKVGIGTLYRHFASRTALLAAARASREHVPRTRGVAGRGPSERDERVRRDDGGGT